MLADAKQILQSALALPDVDRAAIAESLLTSLDQPDAVIDESWAAEAEERLAEFDAGRMKAIPAAEVFEELDDL
jgi:putative addiction module component (TIGR02574 family)